mmetsp:Transcript_16378/g.20102  ORF Transcript_16378/g.20102 Transcript_16378/m.20102 type:complete len:372 (+) Transcript_16378:57-1172(+)
MSAKWVFVLFVYYDILVMRLFGSCQNDIMCCDGNCDINCHIYYSINDNTKMIRANCVDGLCKCNNIPGLNDDSCLPDIFGCNICDSINDVSSEIARDIESDVRYYSCINKEYGNNKFEIRIISNEYFRNFDDSKDNIINVELKYCGDNKQNINSTTKYRPIKLVFNSNHMTIWNITCNDEFVCNHLNISDIYIRRDVNDSMTENIPNDLVLTRNFQNTNIHSDNHIRSYDYNSIYTISQLLYKAPITYNDFVYSYISAVNMKHLTICVGSNDDNMDLIPFSHDLLNQYTMKDDSEIQVIRYMHKIYKKIMVTVLLVCFAIIMMVIIWKMFITKHKHESNPKTVVKDTELDEPNDDENTIMISNGNTNTNTC